MQAIASLNPTRVPPRVSWLTLRRFYVRPYPFDVLCPPLEKIFQLVISVNLIR
jgi:hypothetical protein